MINCTRRVFLAASAGAGISPLRADANGVRVTVDFNYKLRTWDGFGVNYVETCQTRDYAKEPQDYGGFSVLTPAQRAEILDLTFGEDGLKPSIVKMFLDPFHQGMTKADARFDHETTTKWMRYFVNEGLKRTRARNADLQIITTMYGPPPWITKQKSMRGRDLDPAEREACARYMVDWVKYLKKNAQFPVKYISLHNEGEEWVRWPKDGVSTGDRQDYNLFWPPEQVVDFISLTRATLDREGLHDVGVTPGECTSWYRFTEWGHGHAIANSPAAMKALGLITSHGFSNLRPGRWFGDWRSQGIDVIRENRPELHAWVTSTSWSRMDAAFVEELRNNIYVAKVNGIIPWAAIQHTDRWVGGDPNPGCAFRVSGAEGSGKYAVQPGYYFYKQISTAGQAGMSVAHVTAADAEVSAAAFASNGTRNPDAFVIINTGKGPKDLAIEVSGPKSFRVVRTSPHENYAALPQVEVKAGRILYAAPGGSVATFFAR